MTAPWRPSEFYPDPAIEILDESFRPYRIASAAVERIELAGRSYHDQDDWSGYLGHLALEETAAGCRISVVGEGTPAKSSKVGNTSTCWAI